MSRIKLTHKASGAESFLATEADADAFFAAGASRADYDIGLEDEAAVDVRAPFPPIADPHPTVDLSAILAEAKHLVDEVTSIEGAQHG